MDWTTIIVALLALAGTLSGSWLGIKESNRLVNFRLDALEEKVMKHNNLVERMTAVERDLNTAFRLLDEKNEEP